MVSPIGQFHILFDIVKHIFRQNLQAASVILTGITRRAKVVFTQFLTMEIAIVYPVEINLWEWNIIVIYCIDIVFKIFFYVFLNILLWIIIFCFAIRKLFNIVVQVFYDVHQYAFQCSVIRNIDKTRYIFLFANRIIKIIEEKSYVSFDFYGVCFLLRFIISIATIIIKIRQHIIVGEIQRCIEWVLVLWQNCQTIFII